MRMKHLKHRPYLALGTVVIALTATSAQAETKDIKIPKAAVVASVNAFASGMELRIDNMGSFRKADNGTWHVDNSHLILPTGRKVKLTVPRSPTMSTTFRRYNAYINDMTSQTVDVKADGAKLKLRLFFESASKELVVGCVNKRRKAPCKVRILKHKGDINNAHLFAWFKPRFSGSKVEFVPDRIEFDYDLRLDSWILRKMKNVASHFVNVKKKVRGEVQKAFMSEFNKANVRAQLSRNVNDLLFGRAVALVRGRLGNRAGDFVKRNLVIKKIRDAGSHYVITVQYPDIVHRNSVRVVKFAPKSKSLTAACPIKFGFNGTIRTTGKVSGQAWLVYENGKKSKKLPWKMSKAGQATSTLVRQIKGRAGQKRKGTAQLVVSWKGTTGQTFTAKSSKAKFSATCSKAKGRFTTR